MNAVLMGLGAGGSGACSGGTWEADRCVGMMTFEALFSLLALLVVVSMLTQQDAQCAGDAVYEQRLLQDVASVLAKKGTLGEFANWANEGAAAAPFEDDLQEVAAASGRCVKISAGGKSLFSCGGGGADLGGANEVYSAKRVVILKNGFADVQVAIWRNGQQFK